MKITIGDTVLAGTWDESVCDFNFEGGVTFQDVAYFRGAEPKYFNRGNESATISFTVRRVHIDEVVCQMFVLEHMTQAVKTGVVTFTVAKASGAKKAELYANGKLTTVGTSFKGVESRVRYSLKVGKITREKPDED